MNFRFVFGPRNKNQKSRTSRSSRSHRPTFDTLEGRLLLSGTSLVLGTVFRDLNDDGFQESGEQGLPGRTVYADLNNNGQLDAGEISTATDAGGQYTLDVPSGQYTIRAAPMPAARLTAPIAGGYNVTVTDGFASEGQIFGVLFVSPLEPIPEPPLQVPNPADSKEAYVQNLYRNILGRNADPQGLSAWESQLNQGATRLQVAQQIWTSPEHRGLQVESNYQDLLHRPSDAGGKAFWVNALVSGAGEADVLDGFLTSAEYSRTHATDAAFVDGLYNDLLGRTPDANGRADWLLALQQGATPDSVVHGFLFSTESLNRLVNSYYSAYLDRAAEPQGLASWTSAVQTGALTPAQAGENILASEENFSHGLGATGGLGGSGPGTVPLVKMPTANNKTKIWTGTKGNSDNVVFSSPDILNLNRTVTITNNDPTNEIFPFFRAGNNSPIYDGQDTPNQEYRAYIGYQKTVDGQQVSYFGLLPGEHITVKIPMVFWDSGRIYYTTDSRYVTNDLAYLTTTNNPFLYFATDSDSQPTRRYIDDGTQSDTTIVPDPAYKQPPAILYYHSLSGQVIPNAAPAGFVELTIRDPKQADPNINNPAPDKSILGPLASYDTSFVDTVSLPGALEAPAANVPGSPVGPDGYAATQKPFGWVGAPESIDTFQTFLGRFTGNVPGNPLGNFFGVGAWPQYYVTPVVSGPSTIQVPATKNVFAESPLFATVPGPYQETDGTNTVQHYIMGTGGIFYQPATNDGAKPNGSIQPTDRTKIIGLDASTIDRMAVGMQIRDVGTQFTFAPYTRIVALDRSAGTITLSGPVSQASPDGNQSWTFNGSIFNGPDFTGSTDGTAKTLTLNNPARLALLQPGAVVTGPGISGVVRIDISGGVIHLRTQGVDLPGNGTVASDKGEYTFTSGLGDYAVQDLLYLWYAWADYYVSHVKDSNPFQPFGGGDTLSIDGGAIQAVTTTGKNTGGNVVTQTNFPQIKFPTTDRTKSLSPGMGVSNAVLPAGTVISSIIVPTDSSQPTLVNLSKSATAQTSDGMFIFSLPTQIDRTTSLVSSKREENPDNISFPGGADTTKANKFAAVVYTVMKGFGDIPGNKRNGYFDSLLLLQNVIGGNVAQVPNLAAPGNDPVASASGLEIRDQSKSVERGVPDFEALPSYDWYANPAVPTDDVLTGGKSTFNAYSLDPFVYFVHEYLGASAYAFSLDDDAANPNVPGAKTLDVSIGGITPFPNKAEWSLGTQFGPVPTDATFNQNGKAVIITTPTAAGNVDAAKHQITNLTPDAFPYLSAILKGANNGALVIGPGISIAQDVQMLTRVGGNVDPVVDPNNHVVNLIGGSLADTANGNYVFFGPTHVTGTIDPEGDGHKISGLSDDDVAALKTLTAKQTLPAALLVTGPGVKSGATIKAVGPDNSITLDDAHPLDPNFKGEFRFTII
jgi:hypothetical protein